MLARACSRGREFAVCGGKSDKFCIQGAAMARICPIAQRRHCQQRVGPPERGQEGRRTGADLSCQGTLPAQLGHPSLAQRTHLDGAALQFCLDPHPEAAVPTGLLAGRERSLRQGLAPGLALDE